MTEIINKNWVVASHPTRELGTANFELHETTLPPLESGQVLLKTRHLLVNAPMRRILDPSLGSRAIPVGSIMYASGLADVVESRNQKLAAGDLVMGSLGWQQYAISDDDRHPVRKVAAPEGLSETTLLHVMGISGATAYFGMTEYCRPRIGDTLVVSTAAGIVGAIVCQLGKLQGCRVIAITGSDAKCQYVTSELGADEAINYKTEDVAARLQDTCPDGIDIYFDNVGGETLDAVLGQIAFGARVVLCGATSQYNTGVAWHGLQNYFDLVAKQAEMRGFHIFNFPDRYAEAHDRLGALLRDGRLSYKEDVAEGIENAPGALIRVLDGDNFGIQLVRLS